MTNGVIAAHAPTCQKLGTRGFQTRIAEPLQFTKSTPSAENCHEIASRLKEKIIGDICNLLQEARDVNTNELTHGELTPLSRKVYQLLEQVRDLRVGDGRCQSDTESTSVDNVAVRDLLLTVRCNLQFLLQRSSASRSDDDGEIESHQGASDAIAVDSGNPWEGCEDLALEDLLEWFSHSLSKVSPGQQAGESVMRRQVSPSMRRQVSPLRLPTFSVHSAAGQRLQKPSVPSKQCVSSTECVSQDSEVARIHRGGGLRAMFALKDATTLQSKYCKLVGRESFGSPSTVSNVSTTASLDLSSMSDSMRVSAKEPPEVRWNLPQNAGGSARVPANRGHRQELEFSPRRTKSIGFLPLGSKCTGVHVKTEAGGEGAPISLDHSNLESNHLPTFHLCKSQHHGLGSEEAGKQLISIAWEEEFLAKSAMF